MEEVHPGLAGDGPGKQGLSGSGRSDQEHALGYLGSDLHIALGVLEEVYDLLEFVLALLLSSHVLEEDLVLLWRVLLCMALAELSHHPVAACGTDLAVHREHDQEEDDPWQQVDQHNPERDSGDGAHYLDPVLCQAVQKRRIVIRDPRRAVEAVGRDEFDDALVLDVGLGHRSALQGREECGIRHLCRPLGSALVEEQEREGDDEGEEDEEGEAVAGVHLQLRIPALAVRAPVPVLVVDVGLLLVLVLVFVPALVRLPVPGLLRLSGTVVRDRCLRCPTALVPVQDILVVVVSMFVHKIPEMMNAIQEI